MQNNRLSQQLLKVLLFAVFVFVGVRSYCLDMTHDEAYSFFNIKNFWYAQFLCNANSHWLNSLAMKTAYLLGGEEPWQLRWLSCLSAGGFFILVYYWIKHFQLLSLKVLAFSLLCLNPFVLDYFVLARGYASAMFTEMLTMYCCYRYFACNKENYARAGLIFAGLSAIANFNFFYFFTAYSIIYLLILYAKKGVSVLNKPLFYIDSIYCAGIALVVLRALQFIRKCSNDFGLGTDSLLKGVFTSYIDGATYLNLGENHKILLIPAVLLAAFTCFAVFTGIFRHRLHQQKIYFFSSLILFVMVILTVINHSAFGVLYPYYRSQLYVFPILMMVIMYCLQYLIKKNLLFNTLLLSIAGAQLFFFIHAFNFYYTFDFYHQSDSRLCLDEVKKLGARNVGMCHEHYGVYINYYQECSKKAYPFTAYYINNYDSSPSWMETHKLEEFDYLLLYPPYNLSYYKKRPIKFTAVRLMPFSKTLILKVGKN